MAMIHSTGAIQNLLERMTSNDKDFRFMATNDLMSELQRENVRWDDDSETKVTNQLISQLKDKNGEVQNLAVKCLGYLVAKIKDDRRLLVIRSLCSMLKNESEQIRDIASIALKTIVTEMPINRRVIEIVNNDLNPNLLAAISNKNDVNVQLESLDILTDLINRVGSQINLGFHEKMQQELIRQLESDRSAVRKRSMNALSHLLLCCSDELFNNTIIQISQALLSLVPNSPEEAESQFSSNTPVSVSCKTLLQCIATIIRSAGHRSNAEQLSRIMPVIHTLCRIDDDELREYCLQAFEAYVRRCPDCIASSLPSIIDICLLNIAYDPNYNYDEDDTDDEAMEMDNPDDEGSDSEDYSDDDDLSWKVRRASAKCLEAVILALREMTIEFFVTVAPALASRFKEREETVKADIIQTFVSLMKQTRALVNEHRDARVSSPVLELTKMIPSIVNKSAGLLREKAIKTRQSVFHMFIEIMHIQSNALRDHIASLVPGILYSLVDKNSTSNMKIDALVFVQELIKTHQPQTFYSHIHAILPAVLTAVMDSFYKISSEALTLLTSLVSVIRPFDAEPMLEFETALMVIYEKTLFRLSKTDMDLEIKEKAIACMGEIIATFGDKIPQQLPVALNLLHERLGNETTRLTCVKALIKIANSPLPISLNSIFPKAFTSLAPFLRKNSRPLKISTLILIENIVKRSSDLLDSESAQSVILVDIPSLINEGDLYVSQRALIMLTTIIRTHKAFHSIVPQHVIPETLQLIRSPLLQGSALDATLKFFSTLVESSFPGLDHETLLARLVEPFYNAMSVHKQAYSSTAKAIAAISVGDEQRALRTVQQLIDDLKQRQNDDNVHTLTLLSIGEIGKVTDLASLTELINVILQAFNSSSEDVKTAASYALGCAAVGNMNRFLPVILQEIETRNKRQYLILHSLREVISAGKLQDFEPIWQTLMKHCECPEEGTRNVVSECLGKLTLLQPNALLQRLIAYLKQDCASKPLARSTIVAAVKFTISDQPQQIDDLLRQCIGEFLASLQDQDIQVRRVALITLNSAAHNKPSLIVDLLPSVMPLLYLETQVKPELIREVEMGPFKHQVDDGLDSRKAAFECMYTLLDTCPTRLDIFEFLTYVENGLRDHYDIKMLTYLMLSKLASVCPSAVLQRMDRLLHPIEEVCKTTPKENAIKQEHEKQDELKRSALRAFDSLMSILNADRHPVLVKFYRDTLRSDKNLSELYASIHRDTVVQSDSITKMDLN